MVLKLVGKETISYYSNKKGAQVEAIQAHFTYTQQDSVCDGVMTCKEFANLGTPLYDIIRSMTVGQEYTPVAEYNPKFSNYRTVGYHPYTAPEFKSGKI